MEDDHMTQRTCTICGLKAQRTTCPDPECKAEHKRRQARAHYEGQKAAGEAIAGHTHSLVCAHCGETFTARASQKYCDRTCRNLAKLDTGQHIEAARLGLAKIAVMPRPPRAEYPSCKITTGTCPECGDAWAGRAIRKYCSILCARRHEERVRYMQHGDRKGHRKHRIAVYLRDNFTCWLCGQPTATEFTHDNPLSPTLDHLVPKSLGGSDDADNLGTAHWICNNRRGATDLTTTIAPSMSK